LVAFVLAFGVALSIALPYAELAGLLLELLQ